MFRGTHLASLLVAVALTACGASAAPAPSSPAAPASAGTSAGPPTSQSAKPSAAPSASKPLVKVTDASSAAVPQLSIAPIILAKQLGYAAQEGLDLQVVGAREGSPQVIQMASTSQLDFGQPAVEGLLVPESQGKQTGLQFFYELARHPITEVDVSPDSPIQSFKDMKGATIGVDTPGSTVQHFVEAALTEAGLDPAKDVSFLKVGTGGAAAKAMQDKTVTVMAQAAVEMHTIREVYSVPLRLIALPSGTDQLFGSAELTRKAFIQSNRDQVVGFGRAVAKGTIFAIENPEATVRMYWQYVPEQKPKDKSDDDAMKLALIQLTPYIDRWKLDNPTDKWGSFTKEQWDLSLKYLGLTGKVTPDDYYTNALIDDINKFDVNQIRDQAKNYKG
ncbi:MAG: ABC transporter substrate-binding protein [Chloroflexi bacterium]|nr:ABC transporter substrate-binding protein [Chloroflexota bacterium]